MEYLMIHKVRGNNHTVLAIDMSLPSGITMFAEHAPVGVGVGEFRSTYHSTHPCTTPTKTGACSANIVILQCMKSLLLPNLG